MNSDKSLLNTRFYGFIPSMSIESLPEQHPESPRRSRNMLGSLALSALATTIPSLIDTEARAEPNHQFESQIQFVYQRCSDNFGANVSDRYRTQKWGNPLNPIKVVTDVTQQVVTTLKSGKHIIVFGSGSCAACSLASDWWREIKTGEYSLMYVTTKQGDNKSDDFTNNEQALSRAFDGFDFPGHIPYLLVVNEGKIEKTFNGGLCEVTAAKNGPAEYLNTIDKQH